MQVNDNVNAANLLLVGAQASSGKAGDKSLDNKTGFAEVFAGVAEKQSNSVQKTESDSEENLAVNEKRDSASYAETEKSVDTKQKTDVTTAEQDVVSVKEEVSEDVDVPEEVVATISTTISLLLQNLLQEFSLTKEELAGTLERLGVNAEELLSESGMKKFFLEMNQAEVSDLVVNENLNEKLQSFMNQCVDIFDALEQLEADGQISLSDIDMDTLLTEAVLKTESADTVPELSGVEPSKDVMLSEPVVIVDKEVAQDKGPQEHTDFQQNPESDSESSNFQYEKKTVVQSGKERILQDDSQTTFKNPILQSIENAVNQVQDIAEVETAQPVRGQEIINQIVEQVRINMNQNTTSLEMQLYPEHLGKIQINVVSKDGVMTARIVAETEAAKQAIEGGLTNLREAMDSQNLKVEAIEVMVSTAGFERGNENQESAAGNQNTKRGSGKAVLDAEPEEEDDVAEEERRKITGSSVSYSA